MLLVALINDSMWVCPQFTVSPAGRGTGLGMERGELKSSDGVPVVISACSMGQAVEFDAGF